MAQPSIKKQLEELQLKISEYAVEEAKLKKEKAEVELETARLQQAYLRQMIERETRGATKNNRGGTGS